MLRQSIRSSKSLALSLVLGVVAAAGVTGCGESSTDGDDVVVPSGVQNVLVTATDTDRLATGEFLNIDLTKSNIVYRFDYSKKQLDYTRIKLVNPQGADVLADQMQEVQEGDYGANPQPDLLGASDSRFAVSSDPAAFGELTQSELDQLKTNGYFYDEAALSVPQSSPQSTDNCIHAVCEICIDLVHGGPPRTWQPGTFVCYFENHTWC